MVHSGVGDLIAGTSMIVQGATDITNSGAATDH